MNKLLALIAREWKAFWYSPIAYVVGTCFLFLQGWVFWLLIVVLNHPRTDSSLRISQFFYGGTFFYWLSIIAMAPLLTMRSFSEEKRTGTIEVLMSAPVSDWQIVLSKFLGAWLSYCALWTATLLYFVVLQQYARLEWPPILTGYLGTCLMGAVLVSVGVLASSLTRNQVIAAMLSFVFILMFFSIGFLDFLITDPSSSRMLEHLSLLNHQRNFAKGVVDTRPLVAYGSVIAISLFLTIRAVASPRWRT